MLTPTQVSLICHSACESDGIDALTVAVRRVGSAQLHLHYRLHGQQDRLSLPPPGPIIQADNLWQHTCFEAFLRPEGLSSYLELNLAPSRQWAAYGFSSYRKDMRPVDLAAPKIETSPMDEIFELFAKVDLSAFSDLADHPIWEVALAAVAESEIGKRSYWALRHPAEQPDFHQSDCFQLRLAVSDSS